MTRIFKDGKIPEQVLLDIEEYRFPHVEVLRDEKLRIDRRYNDRATFIVKYEKEKIVGVIRIVPKLFPADKLPIEFSTLRNGNNFEVQDVNVCEATSLKVSKYKLVFEMFDLSSKLMRNEYRSVYLTCVDKLVSFYEAFGFRKLDTVHYEKQAFQAMCLSAVNWKGVPF